MILLNKKKLKGPGISIVEDHTPTRTSLRKKCNEKWGNGNVWTTDCAIMVKIGDSIHKIETETNFLRIA